MRQLYAYDANNANESTRGLFEDRMSKGLTKTHTALGFSVLYHVFARKQLILCFGLRYKSYLTLLYVPLITDFFCPGTIAHGSIRVPLALWQLQGCNWTRKWFVIGGRR